MSEPTPRPPRLHHATDARPGIRRLPGASAPRYRDAEGRAVRDRPTLERIRGLAIPPAWTDVWISPDPDSHLQATGRDARGRKQYRYHPEFRRTREATKFAELVAFGEALPRIRARVAKDLARRGLPREKVLALVVRLLELTLIRVGNEEYARVNRSFGLTTLRDRHASVEGARVRFKFRGKSGRFHEVGVRDRRLAELVARCRDLPGQDLFQYLDADGAVRDVTSDDVNGYLRDAAGIDVTAKTFRTWSATVLAVRALSRGATEEIDAGAAPSARRAKRGVSAAMREISERLGNTPAVARTSYVHPAVVDAYLDGSIGEALAEAAEDRPEPPPTPTAEEEEATLQLLRGSLERARRSRPVRGPRGPRSPRTPAAAHRNGRATRRTAPAEAGAPVAGRGLRTQTTRATAPTTRSRP